MFFRKRLKKPDLEKEQKLQQDIEEAGGLEKKDIPAMLISAFLVIFPVALGALLVLVVLAFILL